MNKITNILKHTSADMRYLFIWVVVALIIPNVALDITESSSPLWKCANILLPAGFYMMFISASRRTGIMTLLSLPFMIFAAFQIVLLYLYGESIIAVDMFLNVVTTNAAEVSELLGNLLVAIMTVVLIYLPPLVWGVYAACKHSDIDKTFRSKAVKTGVLLAAAGGILAAAASLPSGSKPFHREIFPVNVIYNMVEAIDRTRQTAHYPETSADFTYNAVSTRPADEKEIYLFIIGETARGENWQLGGYERPNNPLLSQEGNVVFFPKAITESNTTHKSVPMIMSFASAENFDSICYYKSIITAMKEAGFHTRFFSNQAPNRSFTEYFGNEADDVRYTDLTTGDHPYDMALLPMLGEALTDSVHHKQFIVMHSYGSHFLYRDRYPREFAQFLPDDAIDATASHRPDLVNAYDNTILYTDSFIAHAIDMLRKAECKSALLYSADHGEDIFDDKRNRFLHASPTPTYYQLHVGMLAWVSDSLSAAHPEFMRNLRKNSSSGVAPQKSMFNTAIELAGVTTPRGTAAHSLVNETYTYNAPVYLTDLNVAVPLEESGINNDDKENITKLLKR